MNNNFENNVNILKEISILKKMAEILLDVSEYFLDHHLSPYSEEFFNDENIDKVMLIGDKVIGSLGAIKELLKNNTSAKEMLKNDLGALLSPAVGLNYLER